MNKKHRGLPMKKNKFSGSGTQNLQEQRAPVVHHYEDKGNANVNIGGDNNGGVFIHGSREESQARHRETLEKVGKVSSTESEQVLIRTYVNSTIWKKKKFIATTQGELDFKHHICRRILWDLKVPDIDAKSFWARNRNHVRKCLVIKRNNVVSALKQNFMSKCKKDELYRADRHTNCSFVSCIDTLLQSGSPTWTRRNETLCRLLTN
jgi:hypothetical protein